MPASRKPLPSDLKPPTVPDRQPPLLYVLFFTELWERYGFYTMRTILVLYMVKVFLFDNAHSYAVFGAFTALLYLTPLLGGQLADKLLGYKRCITIGGLFLASGYFLLALQGEFAFYPGLGAIITGNGLFKPNVSGLVGELYESGDPRREGGFNIFYAGINVGALIPPLVTAGVIALFGWHAAFIMASVGTLLGLAVFLPGLKGRERLKHAPLKKESAGGRSRATWITVALGAVFSLALGEMVKYTVVANIFLFGLGAGFIFHTLRKSLAFDPASRDKLLACHILILFSIIFWALYQQAAMSLTIFTEYNVNRALFGIEISTLAFQAVNPVLIIALGPLMGGLWTRLDRLNLNPSIPAKFAWATVFMGLGFVILPWAVATAGESGKVALEWIVVSYLLQTLGELLLSPIGLSMITELSPKRMVGLMMGIWFFASAVANALAGFIAQWTALPSGLNDPAATDPVYSHIFGIIGAVSVAAGLLVLGFTPLIKRMIGTEAAAVGEAAVVEEG